MPILDTTNFTELEQFGQIDVTAANDPAFQLYLAAAQARAEAWCGQPFDRQVHTAELYDGRRQRFIRLAQKPVVAVTAVLEDGTALTEDVDFIVYPERAQLMRIAGSNGREWWWTWKRQAVAVTYTAGYAAGQEYEPPDDLKWVVANIALRLYKAEAAWAAAPAGTTGPLTSVALDGVGSRTFAGLANTGQAEMANQASGGSAPRLTGAEKDALSKYRLRRFG